MERKQFVFACAQAKRAPFNAFGSNGGAEKKKKDEVEGRGQKTS